MIKGFKDWEIKYLHDRDIVDSQCISLGLEPPEHPEGGVCNPNKLLFSRIRGPEFWKEFKRRGHTCADFMLCKCRFDFNKSLREKCDG